MLLINGKNVKHALTSEVMPKIMLKAADVVLLQMSHIAWSMCVGHTDVMCKNDRNDRDDVWGLTFGHKKPYIIWRPDPLRKGQFWGCPVHWKAYSLCCGVCSKKETFSSQWRYNSSSSSSSSSYTTRLEWFCHEKSYLLSNVISGHSSNTSREQDHQLPHDFAGKGVLNVPGGVLPVIFAVLELWLCRRYTWL